MAAFKLSEAEVLALRDEAQRAMLNAAAADLPAQQLMANAEVYGACLKGQTLDEAVEVEFSEAARAFLAKLQGEVRDTLADARGTCESDEDTASETFLLYVLDGIAAKGGAPSNPLCNRLLDAQTKLNWASGRYAQDLALHIGGQSGNAEHLAVFEAAQKEFDEAVDAVMEVLEGEES